MNFVKTNGKFGIWHIQDNQGKWLSLGFSSKKNAIDYILNKFGGRN